MLFRDPALFVILLIPLGLAGLALVFALILIREKLQPGKARYSDRASGGLDND